MDRFFGTVCKGKAYIENDLNHLKVKRIKVGDLVEVIDVESFQPYLCRLEKMDRKKAELSIIEKKPKNIPKVSVKLYQCVPIKLSTFDEIVESAVQVGVSKLVPVISKRSFQKISTLREKLNRWNKIALETLKQCGRHEPLRIESPVRLEDIKPSEGYANLFLFEREGGNLLAEKLLRRTFKGAVLVVGPEGGFSREEVLLLEERGFTATSLGNFVLRAEVAAAVAAFTAYHLLLQNER